MNYLLTFAFLALSIQTTFSMDTEIGLDSSRNSSYESTKSPRAGDEHDAKIKYGGLLSQIKRSPELYTLKKPRSIARKQKVALHAWNTPRIIQALLTDEYQAFEKNYEHFFIYPVALYYFLKERLGDTLKPITLNVDFTAHQVRYYSNMLYGSSYPEHTKKLLDTILPSLQKHVHDYAALLFKAEKAFKQLSTIQQAEFVWHLAQQEDLYRKDCELERLARVYTSARALLHCDLTSAQKAWQKNDASVKYKHWRQLTDCFCLKLKQSYNSSH